MNSVLCGRHFTLIILAAIKPYTERKIREIIMSKVRQLCSKMNNGKLVLTDTIFIERDSLTDPGDH